MDQWFFNFANNNNNNNKIYKVNLPICSVCTFLVLFDIKSNGRNHFFIFSKLMWLSKSTLNFGVMMIFTIKFNDDFKRQINLIWQDKKRIKKSIHNITLIDDTVKTHVHLTWLNAGPAQGLGNSCLGPPSN